VSTSNLSNLHPVWRKSLGLHEPAAAQQLAATSPWARTDLAQAVAVMTATSIHSPGAHHGWQATSRPNRPGALVGIKKQIGPGLWASTVARPGDARYPVEFLTHS
jgi:hypothetical protein